MLGALAMEGALRAFSPQLDPFDALRHLERGEYVPRAHAPQHRFRSRMEPGLPGMHGTTDFSVNGLGFRGPELSNTATSTRVFMLGGSTTECAIVDDANAPNAVLQRLLPGSVVQNAGHSGDASFDHVAILAHRIAHLKPDVITLLAGPNDIYAAERGRDYLFRTPRIVEYDARLLAKLMLTRLEIGKLAWRALNPRKARVRESVFSGREIETNYRAAAERCAARAEVDRAPKTNLGAFAANLTTVIGIAQAHGARVVLLTHPTSYGTHLEAWHWFRCIDGVAFSGESMRQAIEAHNDVTRRLAEEHEVLLIDFAKLATVDHFIDDIHFNDAGAKRLAEAIARAL